MTINKLLSPKPAVLFLLFIISRLIFINTGPVFFDSPEYISRFNKPDLLSALSSGHLPLHVGYVLPGWLLNHLDKTGNLLIFFQIILATLTIYCFYKIVESLSNRKVAFISSVICSLLPGLWISTESIMMEALYIPFFIFSLYFLIKYTKNSKLNNLILFCLCFGFSFITHLAIILWIPLIFFLALKPNYKKVKILSIALIITFITASLINSFFISELLKVDIFQSLKTLFISKSGEHGRLSLDLVALASYIRNFIVPLLRNNTNIVIILSAIYLFLELKKKSNTGIILLLWILPALIANQWWDSLFFGRHALISSFGLAFATGLFLEKKKILLIATLIYLLVTTLPALALLKGPIPYLEESKVVGKLPKGILIESHFARPQVNGNYNGVVFFVEEPGFDKKQMIREVDKSLKLGGQVFVTSQALSEPYGLYSGPYLHTISLSYLKPYVLLDLAEKYKFEEYVTVDDKRNLKIFRLYPGKTLEYPVKSKKANYDRLDYYDPISQAWIILTGGNSFRLF